MKPLHLRGIVFYCELLQSFIWEEAIKYDRPFWKPAIVGDAAIRALALLPESNKDDEKTMDRYAGRCFSEMVQDGCFKRVEKGESRGNYECIRTPDFSVKEVPQLSLLLETDEPNFHEETFGGISGRSIGLPPFVPPRRIEVVVSRIIRDTPLAASLKQLYEGRCQVCGLTLRVGEANYCEVHHLRPLGKPHDGPDTLDNMMVLCPNHHVLFDYGIPIWIEHDVVQIEGKVFSLNIRHQVSPRYIEYYEQELQREQEQGTNNFLP